MQNIKNLVAKWEGMKSNGENMLTYAAKREKENLTKHIEKGCLSNIPPVTCGSNRNETLHRSSKEIFQDEAWCASGSSAAWSVFLYFD